MDVKRAYDTYIHLYPINAYLYVKGGATAGGAASPSENVGAGAGAVSAVVGAAVSGALPHLVEEVVEVEDERHPRVQRLYKNCTGSARIARLCPTLWLKIPVRALKLAHNLGQPCTILVLHARRH